VTDTLYYINYPLGAGDGTVTVATVRPETMLADTAVAVNPTDPRYQALVGQTAILPLVGRELPIIADDYVKPEFGTGALKITPGHDPNDFEIGLRHGLEQVSVIGEDGRVTDQAPERFVGLSVADAQRAVVAELNAQGLLERTEPYTHAVPFSERSGERIEPLVSLQWFMRMEELARPAIDVVTSGQVRFWPESYERVYLNWMENIRPWCISRQLWWGHQIPVWYRGDETYAGVSPPDGEGWERDPDVLDTWFSSALFPFAALGWPEATDQLRAFYPTDALVTGREIVFLWVARMIMMGLKFLDRIPFTDVYVHAIIHAPDGRRMSKSLGTGVDPMDLIEGGPRPSGFPEGGEFPAYGADAVRWGMLAMSSTQDVNFSEERIAQGLALVNKLWNAARLVLLGVDPASRPAARTERIEDRWIVSRLARAKAEVQRRIEAYDFAHVAFALYDFIYAELCDWYLELVKPRLRDGDEAVASTLLYVLSETLAMAHPVIPFVTEEIYDYLPGSEGLLAAGIEQHREEIDEQAEASLERMIEAVQALRAWRDFAEVKVGATLTARLVADGYEETAEQLARMARLSLTSDGAEPATSVAIPGGVVEVLPSEELDLGAAERKREKRRGELEREIEQSERKLANPGFVSKAPPQVVDAERQKLARLKDELESL
jgi:valyl-tRNA synthetase